MNDNTRLLNGKMHPYTIDEKTGEITVRTFHENAVIKLKSTNFDKDTIVTTDSDRGVISRVLPNYTPVGIANQLLSREPWIRMTAVDETFKQIANARR